MKEPFHRPIAVLKRTDIPSFFSPSILYLPEVNISLFEISTKLMSRQNISTWGKGGTDTHTHTPKKKIVCSYSLYIFSLL